MSRKVVTLTLMASAMALSACASVTRERTQTITTIDPVPQESGVLQVGDQNFRLLRTKFDGATEETSPEVWRVQVGSWLYQCDKAEALSCMETITAAERGEKAPMAYIGVTEDS